VSCYIRAKPLISPVISLVVCVYKIIWEEDNYVGKARKRGTEKESQCEKRECRN
jgi:hypothetical protein